MRRPSEASSAEGAGPGQMVVGLAGADHRPLDVAHRRPPSPAVAGRGHAAGRRIGGEKGLQLPAARRPAARRCRTARSGCTARRGPRPGRRRGRAPSRSPRRARARRRSRCRAGSRRGRGTAPRAAARLRRSPPQARLDPGSGSPIVSSSASHSSHASSVVGRRRKRFCHNRFRQDLQRLGIEDMLAVPPQHGHEHLVAAFRLNNKHRCNDRHHHAEKALSPHPLANVVETDRRFGPSVSWYARSSAS